MGGGEGTDQSLPKAFLWWVVVSVGSFWRPSKEAVSWLG